MPGEKSARRFCFHSKLFFEIGNEFFSQGRAPRAVVSAVGEDMMTEGIVGVQEDVDHLRDLAFLHLLHGAIDGGYWRDKTASVAVDDIYGWISRRLRFVVIRRHDNRRLHFDGPTPEGGKHRALKLHDLSIRMWLGQALRNDL